MQKKTALLLIIPSLLILTTLGLAFPFTRHKGIPDERGAHDELSPMECAGLREGDVILRRGKSLPSELIARYFGGKTGLSHCAYIVRPGSSEVARIPGGRISYRNSAGAQIKAGRLAVIHTVNENLGGVDGVQIEDLERFNLNSRSGSTIVVRPHMSDVTRRASTAAAWKLLDRAIPFDNDYSLGSADRLYCSELLYHIWQDSGWGDGTLWQTKNGILTFESLVDRRWFEVVLSHNPAVPAQ